MLTKNEDHTEPENITADSDDQGVESSPDSPKVKPKSGLLGLISRAVLQIVLMVAVLGVSFYGMNKIIDAKPEKRKRPSFKTVYTIQTTPAILGINRPSFSLYGQTIAARNVDLRSAVSGEVVWVNPALKIGGIVKGGDGLVHIDKFEYQGAVREAKANLNEAKAKIREAEKRISLEASRLKRLLEQEKLARLDQERISQLRRKGTTTQKQLDDRMMALSQRSQAVEQSRINMETEKVRKDQLTATLSRLEWRLQRAEKQLADTVLKAPFTGIVKSESAEVGRNINANDVLVSLYDDRDIEVQFILTDQRYGRLQTDKAGLVGRKLLVLWNVGGVDYQYPAILDRVGAEISADSGGVAVIAKLHQVPDNPEIRPGAFVKIVVSDKAFHNSVRLPESAVYDNGRVYVKKHDTLEERNVRVHAYEGSDVIVSGDIAPGEHVLTSRITEINDGIKVREEGKAANGKPNSGN